jgi:hypothetical protein
MNSRFMSEGRNAGLAAIVILVSALFVSAISGGQKDLKADLAGRFDLAAARSPQVLHYWMDSQVIHIGFDGKRTGSEMYTLKLKCVPGSLRGKSGQEYTCREFLVRRSEGQALSVPALAGWTYTFAVGPTGIDDKGQVFGIPHAKFKDITDSAGRKFTTDIGYAIYNAFIDFHSFNDLLSLPTPEGRGIQDLTRIGQRIVHAAAFTEPPVNLGSGIKAGSVFRNGEVVMDFKGLGLVDGAVCALVGYDSGESTLKMIMPLSADKDMVTEGGSQYKGDMSIDLATRWLRRMTLDEFVVTRTSLPGPGPKIDSYIVRHLLIRLISREEYEKD